MANETKIQELTDKITAYQELLRQLKTAAQEIKQKQTDAERDLQLALQELRVAREQVNNVNEERRVEEERISQQLDETHEEADKIEAQILEINALLRDI